MPVAMQVFPTGMNVSEPHPNPFVPNVGMVTLSFTDETTNLAFNIELPVQNIDMLVEFLNNAKAADTGIAVAKNQILVPK